MKPFDFLNEEFRSVRAALNETLRHDYGPGHSLDYFEECNRRLADIEIAITDDPDMDAATIATKMRELSALGSRISLIERSHLGEFSWPFVRTIDAIAKTFLLDNDPDPDSDGFSGPLIHVVAEGMHYQIVDDVYPRIGEKRIIVVAFPRQLKHHVLLHSIFGHEIGHTAYQSTYTGGRIKQVVALLNDQTPFQDRVQASDWLHQCIGDRKVSFTDETLRNWRIEIVCDLFGLMLFGPSFVAAHRAILEPLAGDLAAASGLNETHPPYLVRRQVLVEAVKILGWDQPITDKTAGAVHEAELALVRYITELPASRWKALFTEGQLKIVLNAFREIVAGNPTLIYEPADPKVCQELITRLTLGRPPIHQSLSAEGVPNNYSVPTHHCLYAGWCAWFGQDVLHAEMVKDTPTLRKFNFLEINRLCDYGILQQYAIDLSALP